MIFQQDDMNIYQLIDTRNLHGKDIPLSDRVSLITIVGSNCLKL